MRARSTSVRVRFERLVHDKRACEVRRTLPAPRLQALIAATSDRRIQRNLHATQFFHHGIQLRLHLLADGLELRVV